MTQRFRNEVVGYDDRRLADALRNPGGFTEEARCIFEEEADRRGGITAVLERADTESAREFLLVSATKWIDQQLRAGRSSEQVLAGLKERKVEGPDVVRLVGERRAAHERQVYEEADEPGLIARLVVGSLIAGALGSVYIDFLIIGRDQLFHIFGVGLIMMCFGIVRAFSRGKKTTSVYVATVGALFLAGLGATLLYDSGYLLGR